MAHDKANNGDARSGVGEWEASAEGFGSDPIFARFKSQDV